MPEWHYGACRVVVRLDDGSEFRDVMVAWAMEIVRVGNARTIPFDARRIVAVHYQGP